MSRWLALAVAALLLAGCAGGERDSSTRVAWAGEPILFVPERLPRDRILTGRVRNTSDRPLELEASELRALDARGRRVRVSAIFLQTFGHGLFPPTRGPQQPASSERRRTGLVARIAPGGEVPLTVSWRQPSRSRAPVRLDYGAGVLSVPKAARPPG